jgi:hypothetical protein
VVCAHEGEPCRLHISGLACEHRQLISIFVATLKQLKRLKQLAIVSRQQAKRVENTLFDHGRFRQLKSRDFVVNLERLESGS